MGQFQAASPQIDPSARALMARIDALEAALAGRGPVPADGRATPGPAPASAPAPAPAAATPPAAAAPPPSAEAPVARAAAPAPPREPEPAAAEPEDQASAAAVALADPPAPPPPPAISVPTPEGLAGMTAVWPAVLDAVCADNQMLGAVLSDARPVELRDNELVVAFAHEDRFNQRQAALPEHRAVVEGAVRGLAGRPLRVLFELRDLEPGDDPAPQAPPPSEDEIVARFVTEFDAEEIVPEAPPEETS